MIKTLNLNPSAKTAEIMSRYRPIAPKPENSTTEGSSISQKIKQYSPYHKNLWSQLLARPTRTKRRARTLPSFSYKKHKTTHDVISGFCPPCHVTSPTKNLSLHSFTPSFPLPNNRVLNCSLATLPLLPCSPSNKEFVDLKYSNTTEAEIPQEKDLLQQLQGPHPRVNVIAPHPVRPVGSCINVGYINEDYSKSKLPHLPKKAEEVEEEVESEPLPAVISDSNNKVRMANSAYKEMVGQPECTWLESILSSCTRISGEVTLNLPDSCIPISSSNGFSCWVRIDWKTHDQKMSSVNAFCDVIRLSCESRDYLFTWRFHTGITEASSSQSRCNV
ncbi:hypothetical protein SESBI_07883 [Sesbania bispinosa]|nr:hypothetical protein SESBI_07883 [Sesbania bispinosa]